MYCVSISQGSLNTTVYTKDTLLSVNTTLNNLTVIVQNKLTEHHNVCPRISRSIGSLSSDVFERRTSTGSEPFSLLISLDATIFVLLSVLTLIETICPKIWSKLRLKSAKTPLPVDVRRSKTSLLN